MTETEEEHEFVPPQYSEPAKYKVRLAEIILGLLTLAFVFVAVVSQSDRLMGLCIIAAIVSGALTSLAYVIREIVMQKEHFDPRRNTFNGSDGGSTG